MSSVLGRFTLGRSGLAQAGEAQGGGGGSGSFVADAFVKPYFYLDAEITLPYFYADAWIRTVFTLDATLGVSQSGSFGVDAVFLKTQFSDSEEAPTLYSGSYIGSLFTTGSGSKNWTATPGSGGDFVVDFGSRDSQWLDFASLVYGTVAPSANAGTGGATGNANNTAFWWTDISSRSNDTMSFTASYNDGQHWLTTALQHPGSMLIADQSRTSYSPGAGNQNIVVDPDGYDCLALIFQSTDSTSYPPVAATIDNGRTISGVHYRAAESMGSRLQVVEVLAEDGTTTITSPNTSSPRAVTVILVGGTGGGPPIDAWIDAGFFVDAEITDSQGLFYANAFIQPYFTLDAALVLPYFLLDAVILPPPGQFYLNAVVAKTQRGSVPTVSYDSYAYDSSIAASSDSWYHTVLDAAGIVAIISRQGGVGSDLVSFGGLSVPFLVEASNDGDDSRIYATGPLTEKADTKVIVTGDVGGSEGYSVIFTSSVEDSLTQVDVASGTVTGSNVSILRWVDAGSSGGVCVLFAAETGIGSGHHLSPSGGGWTQISQKTNQANATMWWKALPPGETQIGVDHSNVLGHKVRMVAAVLSPTEFGFPLPLDAWVYDTRFFIDAFIDYYFTVDAYVNPDVFWVNAVILGTVEVDPGETLDAWIVGGGTFGVDAIVLRPQTPLLHWDDMTPNETDTWGSPDIGYDYTYPQGGEANYDKAGGVGTFYDDFEDTTKYGVYANDDASANKRMRVKASLKHPSTAGNDYWIGLNSRVRLRVRLERAVDNNDYLYLQLDGTTVAGPIGRTKTDDWWWFEIDADGGTLRARWWADGGAVPDWQLEYTGSYSPSLSSAYLRTKSSGWFGTGNGGPKTQEFDDWKIWIPDFNAFSVDAYLHLETVESTFAVDARINYWYGAEAFVQPYFRLDAETYYATLVHGRPVLVRAYISPPTVSGSFTADAEIAARVSFPVDAYLQYISPVLSLPADAAIFGTQTGSFTIDALYGVYYFTIDALFGTRTTTSDFFVLRSWVDDTPITKTFSGDDGWPIDAHIDGADGTIELDAVIRDLEEEGSFTIAATSAAVGESRGQFSVDALRSITGDGRFLVAAVSAQNAPLRLDAWISGIITLDAVLSHLAGSGSLTADAWVTGTQSRTARVDAVIADASGDYRGLHADAVVLGTVHDQRLHYFEVLSHIIDPSGSFTIDAEFVRILPFTVDARIWQPIFVDAFIESDQYTIYPPSQEGEDGTSTDGSTFSSPSASFDSSLIGETITIEGVDYTIATVVDENTITVTGGGLPYGVGNLGWYIPSGSPTDPLGELPPTTLISNVLIEWSRPDKEQWSDLTGDVVWSSAKFTQSARIGPGTFEMALKGAFSQFVGGEEIRVSVDGYRVFGGYVTDVERGYAFIDDYAQPMTFLSGTDYNALLDRLLIYNAEWDAKKEGSGPYRTWKPFAKGTLDSTIITTVADRFMSDPGLMGLDMTTYVDTIETPAPTTGFQMESGMSLRNVLTEISRITEGVWYIDPYKNLHYHSREIVTAPYPITDGDGGIACRDLRISTSLDVVTNDVFVWGTAAYLDTGDSDIIYSRQTADQDWDVDWWTAKIAYVQAKIDKILQTPYNQRTLKQRTRLEALRKTRAVYRKYLANAEASTEDGSVGRFGRWQYGEFRQDIYEQSKVDRRARAIMQRYSEPVVKGRATVFSPGYGAGQVVEIVSVRHDVADELPIREMTLDFAVSKEPVGDEYYAVPRYALSFGLDPEEPWNIYQFLPFPDFPDLNVHFNIPTIRFELPDFEGLGPFYLDTFEREWSSDEDFGEATNERDEDRYWELP